MRLRARVYPCVADGIGRPLPAGYEGKRLVDRDFSARAAACGYITERDLERISGGRAAVPDSRPCLFFRLIGVSQADPVAPGDA